MRFFDAAWVVFCALIVSAVPLPTYADSLTTEQDAGSVRIILLPADDDTLASQREAVYAAIDHLKTRRPIIDFLPLGKRGDLHGDRRFADDVSSLRVMLVFLRPQEMFMEWLLPRLQRDTLAFSVMIDAHTDRTLPAPLRPFVAGLWIPPAGCTPAREQQWRQSLAAYEDQMKERPAWITRGAALRCLDDPLWFKRFGISNVLGPLQGAASIDDPWPYLPVFPLEDYAHIESFLDAALNAYPLSIERLEDQPTGFGITFRDRNHAIDCTPPQALDPMMTIENPSAGRWQVTLTDPAAQREDMFVTCAVSDERFDPPRWRGVQIPAAVLPITP